MDINFKSDGGFHYIIVSKNDTIIESDVMQIELEPSYVDSYANVLLSDISDKSLSMVYDLLMNMIEKRIRPFESMPLIEALCNKLPEDLAIDFIGDLLLNYKIPKEIK